MDVIYGLLPGMLILGALGVAIFFWAVKSGQYDDMEGAANRILLDDPPPQTAAKKDDSSSTHNDRQAGE